MRLDDEEKLSVLDGDFFRTNREIFAEEFSLLGAVLLVELSTHNPLAAAIGIAGDS
jgi:hypothetical protein